jgi:hypothetical protein
MGIMGRMSEFVVIDVEFVGISTLYFGFTFVERSGK